MYEEFSKKFDHCWIDKPSFSLEIYAQTTAIPDPVFEQRLISLGIDTDGVVNQSVADADISNVTNLYFNTVGELISDLTGIEGFTSLESLNCHHHNLTQLVTATLKWSLFQK